MAAIHIYKYENRKYKFDLPSFKKILASGGDNFVAIYSITGPLRLGKSFMLGLFLKYLQNKGASDWISKNLLRTFKFRGGSARETTGIWIWSEPFVIKNKGRKISIFLMDTQGCFDQETSMQDNAHIFALSILLSSVMICNIKRQLSEDILQFLQYFVRFTTFGDNNKFDEPFQRLMFLIRDWEFPDYPYGYYDDNTSINGKNYKKDALNIRDDQPRQVKSVHMSIMKTFENISFYLMPHPGKEVAINSSFNVATVDEYFLKHIMEFVPLVFKEANIIPKKIGGDYVKVSQFIKFVEKWSQMFEKDKIPEGKTIFEATADIQNEMPRKLAISNYSNKMNAQINYSDGVNERQLYSFHSNLRNECFNLFKSFKRLGGPEFENKYLTLINKEMDEHYQTFCQLNSNKLIAKRQAEEKLEIQRKRIEMERQEQLRIEASKGKKVGDILYEINETECKKMVWNGFEYVRMENNDIKKVGDAWVIS